MSNQASDKSKECSHAAEENQLKSLSLGSSMERCYCYDSDDIIGRKFANTKAEGEMSENDAISAERDTVSLNDDLLKGTSLAITDTFLVLSSAKYICFICFPARWW